MSFISSPFLSEPPAAAFPPPAIAPGTRAGVGAVAPLITGGQGLNPLIGLQQQMRQQQQQQPLAVPEDALFKLLQGASGSVLPNLNIGGSPNFPPSGNPGLPPNLFLDPWGGSGPRGGGGPPLGGEGVKPDLRSAMTLEDLERSFSSDNSSVEKKLQPQIQEISLGPQEQREGLAGGQILMPEAVLEDLRQAAPPGFKGMEFFKSLTSPWACNQSRKKEDLIRMYSFRSRPSKRCFPFPRHHRSHLLFYYAAATTSCCASV